MTYSVHQHWDPLKVCAVGRTYPPEFYSFIENSRVRDVMERIAVQTEEDLQKLIALLKRFGVEIIRTNLVDDPIFHDGSIIPAPLWPRDWTAMIGESFHMQRKTNQVWDNIKGKDWPHEFPTTREEFNNLNQSIKLELENFNNTHWFNFVDPFYPPLKSIEDKVKTQGNPIYHTGINSAMTIRVGKDLFFGTDSLTQNQSELLRLRRQQFPDYRCHVVNSGGHVDGTFCPVVPGLVLTIPTDFNYEELFPGWEIVTLYDPGLRSVKSFMDLKEKTQGKWWVPGEELNDDFTEFVNQWFYNWMGYVEETVFDVNMLVINEKNVVCSSYNEKVFKVFDRYGITPHIVELRHRYFWDGGLHCLTSDLHREGIQKDYFPEKGQPGAI